MILTIVIIAIWLAILILVNKYKSKANSVFNVLFTATAKKPTTRRNETSAPNTLTFDAFTKALLAKNIDEITDQEFMTIKKYWTNYQLYIEQTIEMLEIETIKQPKSLWQKVLKI